MNFSIAAIMRHLFQPQHELDCPWILWRTLCRDLRTRGRNRSRESGAFLLGSQGANDRRVVAYVLYDDLDPHCLDTGIVRFDGRFFSELWALCKARGLTVIADIHVHGGDYGQSDSDQAHPMISRPGHIALILPDFGRAPQWRWNIGMYRYEGAKRWSTVPQSRRWAWLNLGF
jgi:hypothetical protein